PDAGRTVGKSVQRWWADRLCSPPSTDGCATLHLRHRLSGHPLWLACRRCRAVQRGCTYVHLSHVCGGWVAGSYPESARPGKASPTCALDGDCHSPGLSGGCRTFCSSSHCFSGVHDDVHWLCPGVSAAPKPFADT